MLLMMKLNSNLLIMIIQSNSYVMKKTFLQIVLIRAYKSFKIQIRIRINHWKNGSDSSMIFIMNVLSVIFKKIILFSSFLLSSQFQIFQARIDSDLQISYL